MIQQRIFKILTILTLFLCQISIFAQPDNDRCGTATPILLGTDSMSCIPVIGDTRGAEDATEVAGPIVCSESWYADDVWYKVEIGSVVPTGGITIELRLDPNIDTELTEHGMAFYENCLEDTRPIECFTNEDGRRTLEIKPLCLQANSEHFIRIWSSPLANENSGTFSICAYMNMAQEIAVDTTRIIYEEHFDNDLNGWISESLTQSQNGYYSGELLPDDWIWTESTCIPNAFSSEDCLNGQLSSCSAGGSAAFPSGWYSTARTGSLCPQCEPPLPKKIGYLISPSFDFTNESCVNLLWVEAFRGLNGSEFTALGATVEFSIDGGITWRPPSNAVNSIDVTSNYGVAYSINTYYTNMSREIPLLGAENQSDVKIRFGYNGDFYHWIIDDIRLAACNNPNIQIPTNTVAISHIQPMSIHQIDTSTFMLDLFNLSTIDYENFSVKFQGRDSDGVVAYADSVRLEDFNSDMQVNDIQIPSSFVPGISPEEYTFSYTLTDNNNQTLNNDTQTFSFRTVDENVFRKEDGVETTSLGPNFSIEGWGDNDNFNWEIGNIFFTTNDISPSGDPYIFDHISFQLNNYDDLIDVPIKVWLYKIEDNDFDFRIDKDDSNEISTLGSADYVVTGNEEGFVTVPLSPYPESENSSRLILEKNTHYMATVEHIASLETRTRMFLSATVSDQYAAAYRNKRIIGNGDLMKIRYAHAFALGHENHFRIGPADDPLEGNFDENFVPLIRLGYEPFFNSSVNNLQLKSFQIIPSPAIDFVDVSFDLQETNEVQLSIINLDGKIVKALRTTWNGNDKARFDVSDFPSGVYLLQVKTDQGQLTKKFVVSE